MERYSTSAEAAGLVAFFAYYDAGFVNGVADRLDGSMTAA